jgi:hypothetical protein
VGRGFSPDRSALQTDSESTELFGAEAPTHLSQENSEQTTKKSQARIKLGKRHSDSYSWLLLLMDSRSLFFILFDFSPNVAVIDFKLPLELLMLSLFIKEPILIQPILSF